MMTACRSLFYFLIVKVCLTCLVVFCASKQPAITESTTGMVLDVTGLVLARCGSKGIPLKNLAKIGGQTLLQRTLVTLQASGRFSSVWVATDCNTIAKEALISGAQVFRRSPQSATDSAPSFLAVEEFLFHNPDVRMVALFQCTSPFLSLPFIHSAFELVGSGYDSIFSVSRQFKLRWHVRKDGLAEAVNFDPAHRPRRQDWSGELVENGMFYFISRPLVTAGLLQGGRIGVVEIPSNCSLEIDTLSDLEVAGGLVAALARRSGSGSGSGCSGGSGGGSSCGRC